MSSRWRPRSASLAAGFQEKGRHRAGFVADENFDFLGSGQSHGKLSSNHCLRIPMAAADSFLVK